MNVAMIALVIAGPPEDAVRITAPADVVALIAADYATIPEHDRPFMRYVWLPPWLDTHQAARAVAYTANATSRAAILIEPDVATDVYFRYDLRRLVDDIDDLSEYIRVWDEIALLDPRFYAAVEVLVGVNVKRHDGHVFFDCPTCAKRYKSTKFGEQTKCLACGTKYAIPGKFAAIKAGRQLAPHLGLDQIGGLVVLSGVATPVVTADVFVRYALSSIDGGRYYDLVGIERNPRRGTARDAYLRSLGADAKLSEELLALRRVGLSNSGVVGEKPRVVERLQGAVGDVWITYDIEDDSDRLDVTKSVFYNLADFVGNHDAEEVISERQNGLHLFALFDARGNLQDEVPGPKSLPRGGGSGTKRLNIIDCTICHAVEDGLRSAPNHVALYLSKRLDVFQVDAHDVLDEKLRKVASQFRGNLDRELQLGRDAYSVATFRVVKNFGIRPEGRPVQSVGADVGHIYNDYRWDRVDPQRAALELGWKCESNEQATRVLNDLLPKTAGTDGISLTSFAAGALIDGNSVGRTDFDREYAEIAFEAAEAVK